MKNDNYYIGDTLGTDVIKFHLPGGFQYEGSVRSFSYVGLGILGVYAVVKAIDRYNGKKRNEQDLPRRKSLTTPYLTCQILKAVGKALLFGPTKEDADCYKHWRNVPGTKTEASEEVPQPSTMEAETPRQETLIPAGATALLAGFTNAGKSILALQISIEAAGGKKFLILPNRPPMTASGQKVLYISTEENIPQPRIDAAKATLEDNVINFNFKSYQNFTSKAEQGTDEFAHLYHLLESWIRLQSGDCMIVIDNLSVFKSMSNENRVKSFYNKLDEFKHSYRRDGGRLTFLLVAHTDDSRPDIQCIKGSGYLTDYAWPILMHCMHDPKNESSTRYLVLHKLKDDRGGSDETYDFDYRIEPFPHYELAMEDVNTGVNVNESANIGVNVQEREATKEPQPKQRAKNATITVEEIAQIQQLEQEGVPAGEIAKRLGRSRVTVNKHRKNIKHKPKKPQVQEPDA